jgi:hypothetical protein
MSISDVEQFLEGKTRDYLLQSLGRSETQVSEEGYEGTPAEFQH